MTFEDKVQEIGDLVGKADRIDLFVSRYAAALADLKAAKQMMTPEDYARIWARLKVMLTGQTVFLLLLRQQAIAEMAATN